MSILPYWRLSARLMTLPELKELQPARIRLERVPNKLFRGSSIPKMASRSMGRSPYPRKLMIE